MVTSAPRSRSSTASTDPFSTSAITGTPLRARIRAHDVRVSVSEGAVPMMMMSGSDWAS